MTIKLKPDTLSAEYLLKGKDMKLILSGFDFFVTVICFYRFDRCHRAHDIFYNVSLFKIYTLLLQITSFYHNANVLVIIYANTTSVQISKYEAYKNCDKIISITL